MVAGSPKEVVLFWAKLVMLCKELNHSDKTSTSGLVQEGEYEKKVEAKTKTETKEIQSDTIFSNYCSTSTCRIAELLD